MNQDSPAVKPKPVLYNEVAYTLGILVLAFSVVLMLRSGWGNSSGTALGYLLNLRFPLFTIGEWFYIVQGFVLVLLCVLLKQVKLWYFVGFITAIVYGYAIDFFNWLLGSFQAVGLFQSFLCYLVSFLIFGVGVAFFMVSDMPPLIYDLFAREVAKHFSKSVGMVKTGVDVTVLAASLFCSFFFFHRLIGIGAATVLTSVFAGTYMHKVKRFLDARFSYARFFRWGKAEPKAAPEETGKEMDA